MRTLHDVLEVLVQIGMDRFGRHEHQSHVLRFVGSDVFLGNVLDVKAHVGPHPCAGNPAGLVILRCTVGSETFQRKLGIDDKLSCVARQRNHAIGTGPVRKRHLKIIGRRGQAIPHDGLHAALAVGPARLLVGEHILQCHHLAGQVAQVFLGAVDHGQTFIELLQRFIGGLAAGFEALPDRCAQAIDSL